MTHDPLCSLQPGRHADDESTQVCVCALIRQVEERSQVPTGVWEEQSYDAGVEDAVRRFRAEAELIRSEYAKPTHRLRMKIVERLERAIRDAD